MIGQTFSHYRIVERLGAGGMGVVYKAEDTRLHRTVALKFLPAELTQDAEATDRLLHEARAASALDHPNICTIHGIEEAPDGQLFVAMSYYEGETLKEQIARGPLPIADAVRHAADMARAVAVAHDAGVIHRDIKPANIMLTTRGELKLLDFGVAKQLDRTAMTRTGVTFGTLPYMAPEQVSGQLADAKTDVWAMGVVLYEMLTGRLPFDGEHEVALINAIANLPPRPLREARPDVPPDLERIVTRALQKPRDARYGSAREMLADLEALAATSSMAVAETAPRVLPVAPRRPRPAVWVTAGAAVLALAVAGGWWALHASRVREARAAMTRLPSLAQEERFTEAFRLLQSIEPYLAGDPEFEAMRASTFMTGSITTTPEDADIYLKGYNEPDAEWIHLGRSPHDLQAQFTYFRVRIVKPGFTTYEGAVGLAPAGLDVALRPGGSVPDGTVHVPASTASVQGVGDVPVEAFFIDRYEVTNRQFKAFIDAGGYSNPDYWREPFVAEGQTLTREEGMARLRDASGRPGPSGWQLSSYPDGEDDLPVTGVSWYEALAYAAWAGRELPTVHHWRIAAPSEIFSEILEYSNFSNQQVATVGTYAGIGRYGTYDMAGNVREWCWNAVGGQRYILGGAWNEPNYMYQNPDALDPFDRSPINGFRTIQRASSAPLSAALLAPIDRVLRDYDLVEPVSDEQFEIFRRMYAYDATDLQAEVESTDESPEAWRVERVSYAAAYGGERITAYLFLPTNASPPYQTVIYFPHSGGEALNSFEQSEMNYLGFIIRGGRALLLPMYKGTYERRLDRPPDGPVALRDLTVARIKDLQRSVDYVLSRPDLDHDRLAYFGVSLGARLANIALAIEKRFATAVVWSGGLRTSVTPALPEIDEFNFSPRVTTPVLMLNGRQDFNFPIEASQLQMFRLLGTPAKDKKHVLYDGGHVFPFARVVKDTIEWLDRYLGLPQ